MHNPGSSLIGDACSEAVTGNDVARAAYGINVGLRSRRNDVVPASDLRGKFLRSITKFKSRLFISQKNIVGHAGRIVPQIVEVGDDTDRGAKPHLAVQIQ